MGCACKTNHDISKLVEEYGVNQTKESKKTNIRNNFKPRSIFIILLTLLLLPLMAVHVTAKSTTKTPINIGKLFRLSNVK